MKNGILAIVNELGIASTEEIESVLRGHLGEVKKKTLRLKLEGLEREWAIFKILAEDNSYGIEGYIAGPNTDAKDDFDIKTLIVDTGLSSRDLKCVDWNLFSSRMIGAFLDDLKGLKEDLEKPYDDPKNIELRYFDLSIRYHELYGFFFDRHNTDFLVPVKTLIDEFRDQLNKKDF